LDPLEVEALAAVLASEVGGYTLPERRAVAWVARNKAHRNRVTIQTMVHPPGPQRAPLRWGPNPWQQHRPFAADKRPTNADRDLAREVLSAPQSIDPTRGAAFFLEPALMDQRSLQRTRQDWARTEHHIMTTGRIELWGR